MLENSWVTKWLTASQEILSFMDLVGDVQTKPMFNLAVNIFKNTNQENQTRNARVDALLSIYNRPFNSGMWRRVPVTRCNYLLCCRHLLIGFLRFTLTIHSARVSGLLYQRAMYCANMCTHVRSVPKQDKSDSVGLALPSFSYFK
jgi:hypothetical protein